ncbi:hypothetical protein [Lawsonia intracellularis]|uniref:hypothetical protein n=1 Tax=Lawsonia intracellularis TaxID=29546 RepID=UPI0027D9D079|nr:hypothetical protein [Lawsonia intracellularis]
MHTSASHGKNTVEEMYYAAKDKGIDIQGFSEHAPRPHKYSYPIEYNKHLSYNFLSILKMCLILKSVVLSIIKYYWV